MVGQPETITVLRVRGWDRHYENNRTRGMKVMQWVPIPNRLDSEGYTEIMEQRNGAAIFGVWIALLEVASTCSPRGWLVRRTGHEKGDDVADFTSDSARSPHDPTSLARVTRIDPRTIRAALKVLTRIKWLEEAQLPAGWVRANCGQTAGRVPSLEGRKKDQIREPDAPAAGASEAPAGAGPESGREILLRLVGQGGGA